jgi:hypothetical protein
MFVFVCLFSSLVACLLFFARFFLVSLVEFEHELGGRFGVEEIEEPTLRNSQPVVSPDPDDEDEKEETQDTPGLFVFIFF